VEVFEGECPWLMEVGNNAEMDDGGSLIFRGVYKNNAHVDGEDTKTTKQQHTENW
jgi:hypothetical protein